MTTEKTDESIFDWAERTVVTCTWRERKNAAWVAMERAARKDGVGPLSFSMYVEDAWPQWRWTALVYYGDHCGDARYDVAGTRETCELAKKAAERAVLTLVAGFEAMARRASAPPDGGKVWPQLQSPSQPVGPLDDREGGEVAFSGGAVSVAEEVAAGDVPESPAVVLVEGDEQHVARGEQGVAGVHDQAGG